MRFVNSFEFRVPSFGFRVSGFGFRVSGFGFRVSGFGFRVSSDSYSGDALKSNELCLKSRGVMRSVPPAVAGGFLTWYDSQIEFCNGRPTRYRRWYRPHDPIDLATHVPLRQSESSELET